MAEADSGADGGGGPWRLAWNGGRGTLLEYLSKKHHDSGESGSDSGTVFADALYLYLCFCLGRSPHRLVSTTRSRVEKGRWLLYRVDSVIACAEGAPLEDPGQGAQSAIVSPSCSRR